MSLMILMGAAMHMLTEIQKVAELCIVSLPQIMTFIAPT